MHISRKRKLTRQLKAYTQHTQSPMQSRQYRWCCCFFFCFVFHQFVYRLEKITSITLYVGDSKYLPLELVVCSSPFLCCIWPFHTHSLSLLFQKDLHLYVFYYVLSFISDNTKIIVNIICDSAIKTDTS